MAADLAFEPERISVGRQQQLDRRRVETNPMIQSVDFVRGIDALDGHHRHQHLHFRDLGRVAREQRVDVVRLRALDDEVHPIAWNVDARYLFHQFIHLRDYDPAFEGRCLHDDWRVLSVGPGIQVARSIRRLSTYEANPGREIDEIPSKQLQVCMDCAYSDPVLSHELGKSPGLGPREREIQSRRDPALEHVKMLRQCQHRLHHV